MAHARTPLAWGRAPRRWGDGREPTMEGKSSGTWCSTRDLERSVASHRDVLGWKPAFPDADPPFRPWPSRAAAPTTSCCSSRSATTPPAFAGRRVGLHHFGPEGGRQRRRARETLATIQPPACPIAGARTTRSPISLIHDPDGNEMELHIDVPGVDWVNNPELIMNPIAARLCKPPEAAVRNRMAAGAVGRTRRRWSRRGRQPRHRHAAGRGVLRAEAAAGGGSSTRPWWSAQSEAAWQ